MNVVLVLKITGVNINNPIPIEVIRMIDKRFRIMFLMVMSIKKIFKKRQDCKMSCTNC